MTSFAGWESFYVIIGSSGAALTGLQFVVIALMVDVRRGTLREVDAFATPTIVHFCAVLLVSGILSAPWPSLGGARLLLGASGAAGAVYALVIGARARGQIGYKPVLEDWIFHVILPFVAYALLFVAALLLRRRPNAALFSIAAVTLGLLFIGIHNAWDTVTFIAIGAAPPPPR